MQSIFNDELIDEGFSSRSFFVYANKKRFSTFFIAPLTPEQIEHRIQLLDHIRNLTALYGNVKIDPETYEFLAKWWDDYEKDMHKRVNNSPKLLPYYARKNIHVMKVAMQEHFSESLDLHIPLDTFKKAVEISKGVLNDLKMANETRSEFDQQRFMAQAQSKLAQLEESDQVSASVNLI